jgi:hypothetical protein
VTYWNVDKNKRVNNVSCYRDAHVVRNTKHRKYNLVMKDVNLQDKRIIEMKSRMSFLLILLENQLEHPHNLFLTFAQAIVRVQNNNRLWPGRSNVERALLEYACGTGEMKNFQQLYCHKDGNESHLVETMTVFGRVPKNDHWDPATIVDDTKPALLVLPYQKLVCNLQCGCDVLHCKFVNTYHVPDHSRNTSNYSCVHGP